MRRPSVADASLSRNATSPNPPWPPKATAGMPVTVPSRPLGKSTNFDVLTRQEELRQAELRKAQALIDWHKGETIVMTLTGDLLPAFGITVD